MEANMESKYFGIDLNRYIKASDEEIDEIRKAYFGTFLELPPGNFGFSENHPAFLYLMDRALDNNEPITNEDVEEIMKIFNIKADLVEEDNSWKETA
jgi:hypothetical protein